jgi:hypothetical protein
VFPHDLARDLLDKDLRWRNPQRHRLLHERAGHHYLRLMEVGDPEVQQSALFDLMALHPSLRGLLLVPSAALRVTRGASADRAAVLSLIAGHEGTESAEMAALWWDRDPGVWVIVKDRTAPASSSLRAAMALTALRGLVRPDRRSRNLVGAHDLHRPEPDARGRLRARRPALQRIRP